MTGKADFTEEEWGLVREGPPTAGMVALTAEKGGSFRETWALAKFYAEAHREGDQSVSEAERAAIEKITTSLYPSGSE